MASLANRFPACARTNLDRASCSRRELIEPCAERAHGRLGRLATPLPAIVIAELLCVPRKIVTRSPPGPIR